MANLSNKSQSRNQQAAMNRRAARKKAERKRNLITAGVVLAVMAILAGLFWGGSPTTEQASTDDTSTSTTAAAAGNTPPTAVPVPTGRTISAPTPCPVPGGESERAGQFAEAPPMCIDPAKNYTATFDMNVGKVVVDLNAQRSPIATNNFVVLSRYGFYDGSAIFRTDPSIDIIQGGSPGTQSNQGGPGYTIQDDEGEYTYSEGELIMARSSAPNSGGSQYFFSTGPEVELLNSQGNYVTIGKVTEGLDVLKRIMGTHTPTSGGLGGAPDELVIVNDVSITER